jgi:predicted Fe-S protein YdhL (DUF1289 family)
MGDDRICRGCGATWDEKVEWFGADHQRMTELVLLARTRLLEMKKKDKRDVAHSSDPKSH